MPTECKLPRAAYGDIIDFFTGIECNIVQFKLICFIVRHPRTRMSIDSMAGVLDINRTSLKQELATLIEKGILVQRNDESAVTYSLSDDESIQWPLFRLNDLDWREKLDIMARLDDTTCS